MVSLKVILCGIQEYTFLKGFYIGILQNETIFGDAKNITTVWSYRFPEVCVAQVGIVPHNNCSLHFSPEALISFQ